MRLDFFLANIKIHKETSSLREALARSNPENHHGIRMLERHPAAYIMTNNRDGTLYTCVTSNIVQRVYLHKRAVIQGFTKQCGCKSLVYYEQYDDMDAAIAYEKQIKSGSRKKANFN